MRLLRESTAFMQRNHEHGRGGCDSGDFPSGFQSIHDWHLPVQYHHIWGELSDSVDRQAAIFGLAAHFPASVVLDTISDRTTNNGAVIDDQNSVRHATSSALAVAGRADSYETTDGDRESRFHNPNL